jgi:Zn-dependent protease with chaperone function
MLLHELGHIHFRHITYIKYINHISNMMVLITSIYDYFYKTHWSILGFAMKYVVEFSMRRHFEYMADGYIVQHGYGQHLIKFLNTMITVDNVVQLSWYRLDYHWAFYHPSYKSRIEHLRQLLSTVSVPIND